ncbi:DUF6262 family protein, partial [Nonomuraea sp. NPDC004297]
ARRLAALSAAARRKSDAAVAAAHAAIRHLTKRGLPVTFQEVARRAGVSHTFLYGNAELRQRIEHLRPRLARRDPGASAPAPAGGPDNVVLALTAEITRLKTQHRTELAALRQALERAHGENLALRRDLAARGGA